MSTELSTYQPNAIAQQQDQMQTRAVARLGEWAQAASAAYNVAVGLVNTSFVPQQFKGKPEEATAAILSGAEVGLSPMASLKSFDIIQGTAAPRALTLRAIVQSQGHEMVLDESTASRCIMRGKRRGSDEWVKVNWTMDRAKGLGLTNKDNWKKQPAAMLVARATGELARLIAADAILGIGYSIEELTDGVGDDAPATVEPKPATRTMQRKTEPEPEATDAEPPAEPDDTPPPHKATAVGLRTEEQSKRMFAQFTELGIKDRDEYSAYIEGALGHPVESSKLLTRTECGSVLDQQQADINARKLVDQELGIEASE